MADENVLKKFTPSEKEALTLLYVEKSGLAGKTPADLAKLYAKVYNEIEATANELNPDKDVVQKVEV